MKNNIRYFYGININDIHHYNDEYYFKNHNEYYLFAPCYHNLNLVNRIYDFLHNNNIYCLEIIVNKDNEMISMVNNRPYILLKDYCFNRLIDIKDIINYTININSYKDDNWYNMWTEKLDYYEYQMDQYEHKYPLLYDSFFYYDGLTEMAISLLNSVDFKNIHYYISHQRITHHSTLRSLYNPLNLIIDTRVRDIAEYFKYKFFYNILSIVDIDNYIFNSNLSYDEALLFLIRMIYPSYYFDLYDDIIRGNQQEDKINIIIEHNKKYELLLKHIYKTLNNYYRMPEIEWFNTN